MATQHSSSAPPAPAVSRPYRKAHPGYGKQSVSGQEPPHAADFAFLPERERYVAGYVDHLPDGAAMDIKSLAKDLPLYGQMAIGTALRALALAGHLRRVRSRLEGDGTSRWVTLTFWSRTARDNEWWTARLEAEAAELEQVPAAEPVVTSQSALTSHPVLTSQPVVPQQRTPQRASDGRPEADAVAATPGPNPPEVQPQEHQGAAAVAPPPPPGATEGASGPSPAYLALAELGRRERRLTLSAADCAVLEPLAAAWFARGVSAEYLTSALTAGLPEQVGSPVGLVRRRLTDKMPPRLPAAPTPPPVPAPGGRPATPVRGLLVECTDCGRPGRAEALPDGLCVPCRAAAHQALEPADAQAAPEPTSPEPGGRDVAALVAGLRNLMRSP
ncbi:MarR family transcriptional regulator [Streptomyces sp. NBC_00102]|uniref:MarR family transcriptional regulator n=1 Tax=Streptomyces sp. NBC_00102 TaxID=2975652 RepID=UPI002250756F|nr:MarR family transcriptional regulator [Streptomyces sp. NBC_00102]MCX5401681.1 MarR family transcriptional regulator [Streptomyces sp. NBC_00102]